MVFDNNKGFNDMSVKYDITCEECDANYEVLSDMNDRADYCPFCGEFIPLEPDGWDEEESFDE
jgi:hypothetical protein